MTHTQTAHRDVSAPPQELLTKLHSALTGFATSGAKVTASAEVEFKDFTIVFKLLPGVLEMSYK